MAAFAFDLLLALLIGGLAIGAVLARSRFAAIALFIVYGLGIAMAWVRLDAVDVALAEIAIGAGLTGILLIGAAARLRLRAEAGRESPQPDRSLRTLRTLHAAVAAALAAGLGATLLLLPTAHPGLAPAVAAEISAAGVDNPVTAVLLNFRGYDTLLEAMVLVVALVAVWSLSADRFWGGRPGLRQRAQPDGVLPYFARVLPLVGLLVGVHLLWAGADASGGAFQAGTVLAAVWLLVAMAGLTDAPPVSSRWLRQLVVIGPAFFLLVGGATALGGTFLGLPPPWARHLILAIETLLTLSIAVTLVLLVLGVPRRAP